MKHAFTSALAFSLAITLTGCTEAASSVEDRILEKAGLSKETGTSIHKSGAAAGDCDLFTAEELHAAFGGKLNFKDAVGYRERGNSCNVAINGYEGSFIIQAESKDAYEARKDAYQAYERQGSATLVPVSIGAEGFLVNNAQVITIDSQGRALTVALQVFVFDGPLPVTDEEAAAGVQAIAQKALERL